MKKDIEIPIAQDVFVAAVQESNRESGVLDWNVYLINARINSIDMAIVVSKGYGGGKQTTTMRHGMGTLSPGESKKIEWLQEAVLELENEFFLTFFAEGKLFERKFTFPPQHISTENLSQIPSLDTKGVLAL